MELEISQGDYGWAPPGRERLVHGHPDLEAGWRGQSSTGPFRGAVEIAGEDTVREAFSDAAAQSRQAGLRVAPLPQEPLGEA
jgi:hypothetical protein